MHVSSLQEDRRVQNVGSCCQMPSTPVCSGREQSPLSLPLWLICKIDPISLVRHLLLLKCQQSTLAERTVAMLLFLGIPLHPCLHTVPMTVSHPRLLHVKPTLRSLGNPQDVCPCAHAGLPTPLQMDHMLASASPHMQPLPWPAQPWIAACCERCTQQVHFALALGLKQVCESVT